MHFQSHIIMSLSSHEKQYQGAQQGHKENRLPTGQVRPSLRWMKWHFLSTTIALFRFLKKLISVLTILGFIPHNFTLTKWYQFEEIVSPNIPAWFYQSNEISGGIRVVTWKITFHRRAQRGISNQWSVTNESISIWHSAVRIGQVGTFINWTKRQGTGRPTFWSFSSKST